MNIIEHKMTLITVYSALNVFLKHLILTQKHAVFSSNQKYAITSTEERMSLFKHFSRAAPQSIDACLSASTAAANMLNNTEPTTSGLTRNDVTLAMEELNNIANSEPSRMSYKEEDKKRIAQYAAENGTVAAIRHFRSDFPKLRHSTIAPWIKNYRKMLHDPCKTTIGKKRGRPTYLSKELDQKLRSMIINLRTAGADINIHVVRGVLAGLIRSNVKKYGAFMDFPVTRTWVRSLYQRMKLSQQASTTIRPVTKRSACEEVEEQ